MSNIHARSQKTLLGLLPSLLLTLLFLTSNNVIGQGDYDAGAIVFKQNCATCHLMSDKKLTGPGLKDAMDRGNWADMDVFKQWVRNSQKYIKESGDAYAADLYAEYGTAMTSMPLSDEEIENVALYIADYIPPPKVDEIVNGNVGVDQGPDNSWLWLILILVVLFIVFNVTLGVRRSLLRVIREKNGQEPLPDRSFIEGWIAWLAAHKRTTALLVILVLGYLSTVGWDTLAGVGVYQGYAPEQPIKFSHKIHAGDNGINCVYCHHSAEKGKTSGIPSVNVCMNCHKGIREGGVDGTTEIAKIYEAAGWDVDEQAYTGEEKPIEWVRIHNLPDFAYFNHSQHVIVGKRDCKECHGPVEEFGYPMKQHAPLTMGWCIDCHRTTKVDMANGYYDDMKEDLLNKYTDENVETFTVDHIGGLECAKCHY